MKRLLTLTLALCLLMPTASAQQYLFPGSPQSKQKQEKDQQESIKEELKRIHGDRDALKAGSGTESQEAATAPAPAPAKEEKSAAKEEKAAAKQQNAESRKGEPWVFRPKYKDESKRKEDDAQAAVESAVHGEIAAALEEEQPAPQIDSVAEDVFVLDIPETIELTLLLPIKSTGTPSANFLDYYSGALMAVRDLGNNGAKINLSIYDTADAGARITDNGLAESDVIIGPVSAEDIQKTLARCPEGKFIVSPIEPKAASLTDSCHVIQVPASANDQIDELVKWLKEDTGISDTVILLEDGMNDATKTEATYLVQCIRESGLQYTTLTEPNFDGIDFTKGEVRIVVASERDSFLCSSVNSIGKLGLNKGNVTLYSTSRIRSMEGINAECMFNARCHMASNYYVDYNDPDIRKFVLAYRALFQNEPSSFSFHGYDSVKFFVTMCGRYGRQWYKKIQDESWRGMQTDFLFKDSDKAGMVNSAIRRIVYNPDLSTTLQ